MEGKREQSSAKLRNTERIAALCDFEYDTRRHAYGGFFTGFQCEKVVRVIEGLKTKVDELTRENEVRKENGRV